MPDPSVHSAPAKPQLKILGTKAELVEAIARIIAARAVEIMQKKGGPR